MFRPVLYKLDPTTQTGLALLADFGVPDTASTATSVKTSAATALLADITVGDYLIVGGAQQEVPTTRGSAQSMTGFDDWVPAAPSPSRPQGLTIASVPGAAPATATGNV